MTTPRLLSGAVKADYDRLSGEPSTSLNRWRVTHAVTGQVAVSIAVASLLVCAIAMVFGGIVGATVFTTMMAVFAFIPAATVWLVAASALELGRQRAREKMFTLYGITVDTSLTPPVYAIGIPAAWLHPDLTETRRVLAAEPDTTDAQ